MPQTVAEAHARLLHYTSLAGLLGILESQSLRATHSEFLNDSTELRLFFDTRLAHVLESGIRETLATHPELRVLPKFASTPVEADAAIRQYASEMADSIRTTTQRFGKSFVACFSAPTDDRVLRHGLLSQWRGYGKDGGYALVFDTDGIEHLLLKENERFWHEPLRLGDVHYYLDDEDMGRAEPEIKEAEDELRKAIGRYVLSSDATEFEAMFNPVSLLSCYFKHWGFHEECEVRIVATPPNEELIEVGRADGERRLIRHPKCVTRGGTLVPYLDMFSPESPTNVKSKLPIVGIIVGPHPQSELRLQGVKEHLRVRGLTIDVSVSQIPYMGS
ncbi:MAG: hypothetical protein CFE43_00865 [Burkholderiales bacterium PBB3]|nr:MAG: hypothetical protein CFE43_00865 [Burkholderiales bacterium PBB3]